MKRIICLLTSAAVLFPFFAHAQSVPNWKSYTQTHNPAYIVPSAGTSNSVATWMGKKVDVLNGTLTNPAITSGQITNATLNTPAITGGTIANSDVSTTTALFPSALASMKLANILQNNGVIPEAYVQASDNGDMALAINRASAAACTLGVPVRFQSRTYALASSASPQCNGQHWIGQQWTEEQQARGTWFSVSDTGFSPVMINNSAVVIEGIAFVQNQPAPSNTYPTPWSPTVYPPSIQVHYSNGVTLKNLMFDGVYEAVYADVSQRLHIEHIFGQAFKVGIEIHHSFDSDAYDDIHFWPYWSQNANVYGYTEGNLTTFALGRVDTAFMGDLFTYAAQVGVLFEQDSVGATANILAGPPTKFRAHTISCDGTQYCVAVNATGATAQIDSINEQGQNNSLSAGNGSIEALNSAQVLHIVSGQAVIQIGDVQGQFIQQSIFGSESKSACSYIKLNSAVIDWTYATSSKYLVDAAQCDGTNSYNTLMFLSPPVNQNASSAVATQSSAGGATVQWPTYSSQ